MSGQFCAYCISSLRCGLVGAAFGSGTFWSLVRAQLVQFVVAQRRGRAGARQPRQPRRQWRAGASRGEQGSEQCGAPNFFDGLGQWACQEAAGREKLGSKTPAPAQEVGVSRRRPLARAPCLRGSEFFDRPSSGGPARGPGCSQPYLSDCIREYLTEATKKQEKYPPTWGKAGQ